jgi:hypothetical protein
VALNEKYQIKISNGFGALEKLDDDMDINRAWESIRKNMKASATDSLGYCELKQHKPWTNGKVLKIIRSKESG